MLALLRAWPDLGGFWDNKIIPPAAIHLFASSLVNNVVIQTGPVIAPTTGLVEQRCVMDVFVFFSFSSGQWKTATWTA